MCLTLINTFLYQGEESVCLYLFKNNLDFYFSLYLCKNLEVVMIYFSNGKINRSSHVLLCFIYPGDYYFVYICLFCLLTNLPLNVNTFTKENFPYVCICVCVCMCNIYTYTHICMYMYIKVFMSIFSVLHSFYCLLTYF